jgi:ribonuclease BN (tRNA processing enzyme)
VTDFVALLGTKGGPAIRKGSPMPTSSLLSLAGKQVVIDCGLGVARGLADQDFALKDLSAIVITHLHSDHYLELGPLIHTAWTAGLKTPVDVWGPIGLLRYWLGFLDSMADDLTYRIHEEGRPDLTTLVRLHALTVGTETTIGPIRMTAGQSIHPPLTETFALRFEAGGKAVVFSGDTAHNPALAAFARDADLLVHEAMLSEGLKPLLARIGNGDGRLMAHWLRGHTLAHDAAAVARAANVKALALHHLIPSDDPAYGPEVWAKYLEQHWTAPLFIGQDGLRIPF